jgi:hypothetical protein
MFHGCPMLQQKMEATGIQYNTIPTKYSKLKFGNEVLETYEDTKDILPTSENTRTKGTQTWTPQKKNNAERRESFILRQTYFSVNNDMQ